jgi:hypothetical protein
VQYKFAKKKLTDILLSTSTTSLRRAGPTAFANLFAAMASGQAGNPLAVGPITACFTVVDHKGAITTALIQLELSEVDRCR